MIPLAKPRIVNGFSEPHIGEKQIYLAHIARDDYLACLAHKYEFNALMRKCGAMRIDDYPDKQFCASLAFMEERFRYDFVAEMRKHFKICVCVDFHEVWIDRRFLPPPSVQKHEVAFK